MLRTFEAIKRSLFFNVNFTVCPVFRNSSVRFFLLSTRHYTLNTTSFHIFASTASGDRISLYAKMLKSTAYLRPSKEQSKNSPSKLK